MLSQEEIREYLTDFATSYIEGRIKIHFPDVGDVVGMNRAMGKSMDWDVGVKIVSQYKTNFDSLLLICLGRKKATPSEFDNALSKLLETILTLRHEDRIEGPLAESKLAQRVNRLEEGIDKVNNLVQQMVDYIYGGTVQERRP